MAEAQRLIAVSLGKIAQSRGQRGGASLFKNLLVSTVLHKARHEFMKENFAAMMQARKAQAEERKRAEEEEQPPRPQTPAPSVLAVISPVSKNSEEKTEDKENAPPRVQDSENVESHIEDKTELTEEKPCAKCTKRRLADVQPQSNGALCESSSPNKRARRDSDSSSSNDKCDIKSSDVSSSEHEPMQTEQISNLVNRFNSLLGSSHNENSKNICQNDSIVPYCGTKVTFSESLGSRPVIALSV